MKKLWSIVLVSNMEGNIASGYNLAKVRKDISSNSQYSNYDFRCSGKNKKLCNKNKLEIVPKIQKQNPW